MSEDLKSPSNRQFGLVLGLGIPVICYLVFGIINLFLMLISCFLVILGLFNSSLLSPLNRWWLKFGLVLGYVTTPIALSLLYFGILTPFACLLRVFGRDELKLKRNLTGENTFFLNKGVSARNNFDEQF